MSGNGSGYSEYKEGDALPVPPVKGTEGGPEQLGLISKSVGGKSRKLNKLLKSKTVGGDGCPLAKHMDSTITLTGGKKKASKANKTNKRRKTKRSTKK
jgi:hypothetical protein